jgi:hypothetical protein
MAVSVVESSVCVALLLEDGTQFNSISVRIVSVCFGHFAFALLRFASIQFTLTTKATRS